MLLPFQNCAFNPISMMKAEAVAPSKSGSEDETCQTLEAQDGNSVQGQICEFHRGVQPAVSQDSASISSVRTRSK